MSVALYVSHAIDNPTID